MLVLNEAEQNVPDEGKGKARLTLVAWWVGMYAWLANHPTRPGPPHLSIPFGPLFCRSLPFCFYARHTHTQTTRRPNARAGQVLLLPQHLYALPPHPPQNCSVKTGREKKPHEGGL